MTVIDNQENIKENNLQQQEKVEITTSVQKNDSKSNDSEENNLKEEDKDPNWKAFREARKKDRAEKEAAERKAAEKDAENAALKAAMEAAFSKSSPSPQAYQQYYGMQQSEESEDERIEKKVQAVIAIREAAAEKERLIREQREYPNRLIKNYPDFNQVIAEENLDYLDYHYPEISRPLQRLNNDYDKWEDIYKAVKKFVPNNKNHKKEAERADSNFNKPKSISSPGITQPGQGSSSNILTEQRRAANWERMQKTLKGLS